MLILAVHASVCIPKIAHKLTSTSWLDLIHSWRILPWFIIYIIYHFWIVPLYSFHCVITYGTRAIDQLLGVKSIKSLIPDVNQQINNALMLCQQQGFLFYVFIKGILKFCFYINFNLC